MIFVFFILKKIILKTSYTLKENFTYFFIFIALLFVVFFNFAESTGRITSFDPEAFELEIIKPKDSLKSSLESVNFNKKDSLVFDEITSKDNNLAKGGIDDSDYYDIGTTGNDSITPLLSTLTTNASQNNREEIIEYVVQPGDSVSKIAAQYGVSVNTILWENNLRSTSYIKKGQILRILPTTGIIHTVKKGDSVLALAKKYKAKSGDIINFNSLPADGALQIGEKLIIPDGEKPYTKITRTYKRTKTYAKSTINANKYYIFPVRGVRTQGIHGYNAVDVGAKCGTPIYAAADGKIIVAKTTRSRAKIGASVFGGYGNHIRIKHPNGTVTLYAHMKSLFVKPGQTVKQGQQIGLVGGGFEYINGKLYRMQGAGRSTGCHLHFEVRGAKNPLARYYRYY